MRRRQERFVVLWLLVLAWFPIGVEAQASTNSDLLDKARQALSKRDYTHALELLKQVDPARPERATMLALANGMACQTHGVVSQQDPSADAQCAQAKQFFTQVLSHSPQDGLALSWLGALSFHELGSRPARFAKLDEVRGYFTTLLAAHPDEPAWRVESEYWLGVTAWTASYWRNQDAREDYNRTSGIPLRGSDPLPEPVRIEYARQCGDMINQGIEILQKRVDQQGKDVYSLAYLNLLLRRRADLEENAEMRAKDLRMADQLVSRIQEVQKSGALVINIPLHPAIPPPPPPPPTQPSEAGDAGRIRVGGNVQAVKIVKKVEPVYPPLARQTGIEGAVRLHIIIGKDGSVEQLEVVSGHPLLQQAALDAVRHWVYQPTLLNGNPVEVDTTIDVFFTLNRPK